MKVKEINQHNNFSILIILSLIITDIGSFYYSHKMVLSKFNTPSIIDYPMIIILGILILFRFFRLYNPSSLQSRLYELKIIFILTSVSTFLYLIYKISFNYITIQQSQHIVFLTLIFLLFVTTIRLLIRTFQKQLLKINIGLRDTIVLASKNKGYELLNSIFKNKYSGYKIVGYFSNDKHFNKQNILNDFNLNTCIFDYIDNAKDFIVHNNIKDVIIAFDSKESKNTINVISELRNLDVCIKIVPDMYDLLTGYAQMHSVTGMPLIDINPNILTELQFLIKRFLDIFVSFFGLILMSPILFVVSIIIKLTSKGPIIFKQERIGLNYKPFTVHKFRTMHEDSEKLLVLYGQRKMIQE